MSAKLKKSTKYVLKQIALGLLFVVFVGGIAFLGSATKRDGASTTPLILAVNGDTYDVSVDELTALFYMANVAEDSNLSASSSILSSYYSAKVQYTTNQYSLESIKIEKPVITDVTGVSKGVITYVVEEGDTIPSIIASSRIAGLTADQVRWSNGLKTASISAGNTIYLPAVAGIVRVVKAGETPSSLASRYGSTAAAICSANYLGENCSLKEGLRIVIPGGVLPLTERPEYVAPAPVVQKVSLRYTSGNPYVPGQCTWYAWQWRHNNMSGNYDLPSNLGNARTWGIRAANGYIVNRSPSYGAVFVNTYSGYYGHVGIVTKVNGNQITITDMNGPCGTYCVSTRVIDYSEWSRWTFIHQKIGT